MMSRDVGRAFVWCLDGSPDPASGTWHGYRGGCRVVGDSVGDVVGKLGTLRDLGPPERIKVMTGPGAREFLDAIERGGD